MIMRTYKGVSPPCYRFSWYDSCVLERSFFKW